LVPLVAIAGYGIFLRINQYGLTPDRVEAFACAIVAGAYALGYAYAAVAPGLPLKGLERTNVLTAYLVLAIILAIFSPLADPARISVVDQVMRLQDGVVTPDKFDYEFLRFRSGRYGPAALTELKAKRGGAHDLEIAKLAGAALDQAEPGSPGLAVKAPPLATRITVYPKGAALPPSFLQQDWRPMASDESTPPCLEGPASCDAFLVDLGSQARPDVLVSRGGQMTVFAQAPSGSWIVAGTLPNDCPKALQAMKAGQALPVAAQATGLQDLMAGGQRLHVTPPSACS
jgi:hypothetical protein